MAGRYLGGNNCLVLVCSPEMVSVQGPKTEKAQEPTVENMVRGIRRLGVSEAEWRVRKGG